MFKLFLYILYMLIQHLNLFIIVVMVAILVRMKWYLAVILTDISLMINDAQNLYLYLMAIHMSSLEKQLFRSWAHV